eukprot:CAMPEP_0117543528 /NCGR_PEP_ID=MMETSP0784-20121206/45107_1 /TAXON_ID=39447 /ORGANISM="" /LENGTH=318 /DNA_ID=CAMNT_0005340309 /DNA_START=49 /DNA_END=1005 /DNA_ORIENTATION=-
MAPLRTLLSLLATAVAAVDSNDDARAGWPVSLEFLKTCNATTFFAFVEPLVNMTTLSYTATWGTYYKARAANATVSGWRRALPESNPKDGGMRALTFLAEDGRGVVAFRGTDLGPEGRSSKADLCADDFLSGHAMPEWCLRLFTHEALDYFARAVEFAEQAALAHPGVRWLYTGHSLGAQLAELVASVRGAGHVALGFSAPAVLPVLRNRTQVDPALLPSWQVVALYNEWDPLRSLAQGALPGSECLWEDLPSPAGCQQCAASPSLTSAFCSRCFNETHVWKHYIDLIKFGHRPRCSGIADVSNRFMPPPRETEILLE